MMELTSGFKTTSELLKHVSDLVGLAISEAAMVKVFIGRWASIRKRLDQFPGLMVELQKSSAPSTAPIGNTAYNDLLLSMMKSLVETRGLAERCLEDAFGGKLQMQSSLDALSMKLEMNLQECQLHLRTKMMKESGPTSMARESVKWNVKDLLARLQMGCPESKSKAMESLAVLMDEDDKNVLVVAKEGGVQALVHMLDVSGAMVGVREKVSGAVHRLSQVESCEKLLVTEGVFAPLVRVLESGSPHAKERAAAALGNLTFSRPDNVRAVVVHGGVPALLDLCRTGTPVARSAASGVVRNLACAPDFRKALADEGAMPVLIALVNSGTPAAQECACEGIQHLCSSDECIRKVAVREGATPSLIMYYDNVQSPKGKEVAMGALTNLASSAANVEELLAAGFLPRLVRALRSGLLTEQVLAASAVCHLAKSQELQRVLGEVGCMGPLVRMLDGKTSTTQELAARAISELLAVGGNRKLFCKEEGGIEKMVGLLDPSNKSMDKKFPVCALAELVGNKKCRKEMIAANACAYLAKLADSSETSGAKKLLERLEHGKIWGLLRS